MTIDEVRKLKAEAEAKIAAILAEFQETTGAEIMGNVTVDFDFTNKTTRDLPGIRGVEVSARL